MLVLSYIKTKKKCPKGGLKMKKLLIIGIFGIFLFSLMAGVRGIAVAADPIKIGYLAPYVGVYAKNGKDLTDGFKLYLDEIGYKVAGREIVLIGENQGSQVR